MILNTCGCAIPQPRGEGLYKYVKEPTTGAGYHLYLPSEYVKNDGRHPSDNLNRWPLVMTFHGMKPYDNALLQEREWEQEADTYGYVVCAPELSTCDSFMEYPLTKEHSYVLEDKKNVLAIMDHVFATTLADPKKVLSTSWSSGGYLAHYFPNRFPERFTCIATRLSNFSSKLLIEETVPRYREKVPVAIFIGDRDFPSFKGESEEAVAWYAARGFRVVRGKMIDNMGHSRIPQTAGAFFAEHIELEPLHPKQAAATVALVQMTEYFPPQELIARVSPPLGSNLFVRSTPPPDTSSRRPTMATTPARPTGATVSRSVGYSNKTAGKKYPYGASPPYDSIAKQNEPKDELSGESDEPCRDLPRIGILPLESDGSVPEHWHGMIAGLIRSTVARTNSFCMLSSADAADLVKLLRTKQIEQKDLDNEKPNAFGKSPGSWIVRSRVNALGGNWVLRIEVVNVETGAPEVSSAAFRSLDEASTRVPVVVNITLSRAVRKKPVPDSSSR